MQACGIELEVEAGTFTVCRIVSTDASWLAEFDVDIEDYDWVTWYDPENNLVVKRHYSDPRTDQGTTELSAYELLE